MSEPSSSASRRAAPRAGARCLTSPGPRMSADTQNRRVLLLSKSWALGGMERFVARLALRLPALGFAVRTVLPERIATAEMLAWFDRQGVEAEANPAVAPGRLDLRCMLRLAGLIRGCGAGVVNIHSGASTIPLTDVLAVRMASRARCVVSPHLVQPVFSARQRLTTRIAGHLCDVVVVTNDALRDRLAAAGVSWGKLRVIPAGVPPLERAPSRSEARRRLGLAPDAFVVTTVARLVANKGIDVLVSALARLPDPQRRIQLVVAGEGPERSALAAAAAEQLGGRALFLGFLDEPAPVYAAADVFALPSLTEGIPLVLIEAAQHALPSVASDLPGVRRAIIDRDTGLLVPPGDAAALAEAISCVRDDDVLRARLGAAARAHAAVQFMETPMIEGYADVLTA